MDVVKSLYAHFTPYIQVIFRVLSPLLADQDPEISVPAIEYWSTVAQEDSEKAAQNGLILQVHDELVKILLQNLLIADSKDNDEEVSTKDSSYKCLLAICEVAGDPVLGNFLPFISNTIASEQAN